LLSCLSSLHLYEAHTQTHTTLQGPQTHPPCPSSSAPLPARLLPPSAGGASPPCPARAPHLTSRTASSTRLVSPRRCLLAVEHYLTLLSPVTVQLSPALFVGSLAGGVALAWRLSARRALLTTAERVSSRSSSQLPGIGQLTSFLLVHSRSHPRRPSRSGRPGACKAASTPIRSPSLLYLASVSVSRAPIVVSSHHSLSHHIASPLVHICHNTIKHVSRPSLPLRAHFA
jgi:hypothetical protein